jgi:hypothetical protein
LSSKPRASNHYASAIINALDVSHFYQF